MPSVPASELDGLLTPLPVPDGAGPVAAVAAYRYRWADVFALDADGRVLSWGDLDGSPAAIAACPGGSSAVALVFGDGGADLRVVDLTTMQAVGEPLARGIQAAADELVCVPGEDPCALRSCSVPAGCSAVVSLPSVAWSTPANAFDVTSPV